MIMEDCMLSAEHDMLAISKFILEHMMWNLQRILLLSQQSKIAFSKLILAVPIS